MTGRQQRWSRLVDGGVQQERTALAWERTAIAGMVVSVLLLRIAANRGLWWFTALGAVFLAAAAAVLVWAAVHYTDLHEPIVRDAEIVHPRAARFVGLGAILLTLTALALAIVDAVRSLTPSG